nr:MATE family efflux transporter [Candidatus Sigynarchaeum springense]
MGYIMGVVAVVNLIGATEPSAIGGYNTAMWIMWVITLVPVLAWTEATNIAVGHAYGERKVQAMKDIQALSTLLMVIYMGAWVLIGAFWWGDISKWLNSGISEEVALYSVLAFQVLIVPYIFFVIGSGLKAFFIGTGNPAWVFLSSAIVNVAIYIPLGLATGTPGFVLTFQGFLWVTFVVFSLDLVLTMLFLKYRGYSRLPELSSQPDTARPDIPKGKP